MKRLSQEQIGTAASRARALGEPTRVRILDILARNEQPVGQIAAALSLQQSSASRHLQVLYHAGLVQRRREASTVIYSLCLLYTSPSPRDVEESRMPSSA